MSNLAKKTHLSRRNLYKIFSGQGNPTLNTFFEILKILDMKLGRVHTKYAHAFGQNKSKC
ncbi:MAG: helix-turn-helix domain-containing protein [Endomicrobium sp.]|jgi:probable addiction module antidote protein|nr:helix-turn-helix domain-containing protein [Endomicrobium sp.]